MADPHSDPDVPDPRLSEVLVACLEALDRGRPLDFSELLARHPEFAPQLEKFLDDQGAVERLAAPLPRPVDTPAAPSGSDPGTLGDFRLVREVGRGGMGVVYEAEQISLRRRGALNGLPLTAAMDPRAPQ